MQASKLEAADGNLGEAKRCEDEHGPRQGGSDWGEPDQTMKNKVSGAIQTILAVMLIWMRTTLQPLQPGTSVVLMQLGSRSKRASIPTNSEIQRDHGIRAKCAECSLEKWRVLRRKRCAMREISERKKELLNVCAWRICATHVPTEKWRDGSDKQLTRGSRQKRWKLKGKTCRYEETRKQIEGVVEGQTAEHDHIHPTSNEENICEDLLHTDQ